MFSGFNLKIDNKSDFDDYLKDGEQIFKNNKAQVKESLDQYFDITGTIDGTALQSDWFPEVECDIFLSHSHKDEQLAKGLAGWLNRCFGLKVFIDSCVWGYSLDLQKKIDKKYCKSKTITTTDSEMYDYQSVIYSTSHVNMMLSTALTMMLDKAESVFLLNTPNVLTVKDTINHTQSPWIYHEISMTSMIRKKQLNEYRKQVITEGNFNESASADLRIKYQVDVDHLISLEQSELYAWKREFLTLKNGIEKPILGIEIKEILYSMSDYLYPLDVLYKNKRILEGDTGYGRKNTLS